MLAELSTLLGSTFLGLPTDRALRDRWRNASWSLSCVLGSDISIVPVVTKIQGLGAIDDELRYVDRILEPYVIRRDDHPLVNFGSHLTRSQLWILGIYEVTRVISFRAAEVVGLFAAEGCGRIHKLKQLIERLRAPLAKMEAADAHRDTDFSFPLPAFGPGRGTEWAVNEQLVIPRSVIANGFLDVFEKIRHGERLEAPP